MAEYSILSWQSLLRPPLSDQDTPSVPDVPLKALAYRNSCASFAALVTADEPVDGAQLVFSDLVCDDEAIAAKSLRVRQIGAVNSPEAGLVSDSLIDVDRFVVNKSAALLVTLCIPRRALAGTYRGTVSLVVNDQIVAGNSVEIEVVSVTIPDVHDWSFFLNVWMNPAAIADRHGVDIWSDGHFALLKPYIEDLALHGQKTTVAPIAYQPWGTQTRCPYPNTIIWHKRDDDYTFDFSVFDRYVSLHHECGIDRAIHCYSIVQGPGDKDQSVIEYIDEETGERRKLVTKVGDPDYVNAWKTFFKAFGKHLAKKGWMDKTYIAFDEKPAEVMSKLVPFLSQHAADFKISVSSNTGSGAFDRLDDVCLMGQFDERGVVETVPPMRSAMGVAELLEPDNVCSITHDCPAKTTTTFYVRGEQEYPNTFVNSPLVESRMLPFLAIQGGFDGFLRWSYNDWSDQPYDSPGWGDWPTGYTFFVYPGENGPISSLRWEQLREGIQDYEAAMIASLYVETPEEMIDYEQAITLACRNIDGRTKSIGDIEIARRLLVPIAAHHDA